MKSLKTYIAESVNESSKKIETEADFLEYGENLLKTAHGEKYDKSIADKMLKDILASSDGDFGQAIGRVKASLG